MKPVRAIVADDEEPSLDYLVQELGRLWPELHIAGVAGNGAQALALIEEEQPDIAFLDIRMPLLSGLEVALRVGPEYRVVFVTAHDQYAVEAFEREAIDYVLKPVTEARLKQTIERLKRHIEEGATAHIEADTLQDILKRVVNKAGSQTLNWIRAANGDAVELVPVDTVLCFRADNKYTSVITEEREYLIRKSIQELEQELDPDRFWRIHRGCIVRVDAIERTVRQDNGLHSVYMRGLAQPLTSSRAYAHLFKRM